MLHLYNFHVNGDVKVRVHRHVTGEYRASAHRDLIPTLNQIIKFLLYCTTENIMIPILSCKNCANSILKVNVIPNGWEICMSFNLNNKLVFFVSSSLDISIKNLGKDDFKYLSHDFDKKRISFG